MKLLFRAHLLGLAICVLAIFAVTFGVTPSVALTPGLDEIALLPVDVAENPAALTTSMATAPTDNAAIAARSAPTILPIAAAMDSNTGDVSALTVEQVSPVEYAANYPNPFNFAAKTVTTAVTAATVNSTSTSVGDNFGAVDRAGLFTAAVLNISLPALEDNLAGTAVNVTTMDVAV